LKKGNATKVERLVWAGTHSTHQTVQWFGNLHQCNHCQWKCEPQFWKTNIVCPTIVTENVYNHFAESNVQILKKQLGCLVICFHTISVYAF